MAFKFTEENIENAKKIIAKYPVGKARSAVMPLLYLAQEQNNNYISKEAIEYIAEFIDIPVIKVYEVASFYTMFNLERVGHHHIQVCGTVPCWLVGANEIIDEVSKKVKKNHVSESGMLSLKEVECLGACTGAPVVQINDTYYENMSAQKIREILMDVE